jgi:hypothetical protein
MRRARGEGTGPRHPGEPASGRRGQAATRRISRTIAAPSRPSSPETAPRCPIRRRAGGRAVGGRGVSRRSRRTSASSVDGRTTGPHYVPRDRVQGDGAQATMPIASSRSRSESTGALPRGVQHDRPVPLGARRGGRGDPLVTGRRSTLGRRDRAASGHRYDLPRCCLPRGDEPGRARAVLPGPGRRAAPTATSRTGSSCCGS